MGSSAVGGLRLHFLTGVRPLGLVSITSSPAPKPLLLL